MKKILRNQASLDASELPVGYYQTFTASVSDDKISYLAPQKPGFNVASVADTVRDSTDEDLFLAIGHAHIKLTLTFEAHKVHLATGDFLEVRSVKVDGVNRDIYDFNYDDGAIDGARAQAGFMGGVTQAGHIFETDVNLSGRLAFGAMMFKVP